MTLRIGLMGFGRIGRNLFRILHRREDMRIVAVSDIAEPSGLEYLLRYDTLFGRFQDTLSVADGYLYTAGRRTALLRAEAPGDVAWREYDVDIVIEATSRPRSRAELTRHLEQGARAVVLCSPSSDAPDVTVVTGVNDEALLPSHRIISHGSVTAHCAAPLIKILDREFGIERLFLTTVHAYTNAQRLADVPADDLRRSRAATENIIPTDTNAGALVMELLPALAGKVSALAVNVPVADGSLVDMVVYTREDVSVTSINQVVRTGVDAFFPRSVEFSSDPIVSSDVLRSSYSSTFDSLATMCLGQKMAKLIAWYNNGWGYTHRLADLLAHIQKVGLTSGGSGT